MQVQLTDFDRDQLKRFHALMEERRKTYGSASLKIVLVRYPGQTEWRNSTTLVHLGHKEHSPEKEETFRYPNCIISKRGLTVDGLVQLVDDMVANGKMVLGDVYPAIVQGHFSTMLMYDYQPSDDEIFNLSWPADRFVFEPMNKGGYPVEPFAAIDAPLFPGPYEMLRVWTGIDVSHNNQFIGSIIFLLPNYSAR